MVLKLSLLLISLSTIAAPKNIIFIVTDGMGIASVTGARVYKGGVKVKLNLEKFKTIGLSKTHSSDNYTTDSAAGATAFSCGVKTYNGSIAMSDPKVDKTRKSRPLQTVFDVIKKKKMSTGIITTTSVTHATPASFYAHAVKRSQEKNIAKQVLGSNLKFLLGGGQKFFKNQSKNFKQHGWDFITTKNEFSKLNPKSKKPILGLFNKNHLAYQINNKDQPSLTELVKFGVQSLKKYKNGYFLVIESGRIDHAGHANKAKEHFTEILEMDKMLGYLLKNVNLNETLIVLTSDHETGGLALNGYGDINKVQGKEFIEGQTHKYGTHKFISWATGPGASNDYKHKAAYSAPMAAHTTVDVPIYAIGNGHQKFAGFMNNNEIMHKILKLLGLKFNSKVNLDNL
ncbi:MAG: alkaline phosphatase [Bacteriovoracaceae bacterium]|jgi:alkaline phosphatase|nr:alkaline phosphatase [Bacteriovoracaceae bacterium]